MPILFLLTLIDLMGFGMIFPLLPLFKLKFSLSSVEIGYVTSLFALFAIFGNLTFGIISDYVGRKLPLALPMFATAIIYYWTGQVETFSSFIMLRCLAGFFAANFSVAFAAAADVSSESNRFKNIAIISSAFGLGFVLGPALGGFLAGNSNILANIDFATPFNISAILNIVAGVGTIALFKESLHNKSNQKKPLASIVLQIKKFSIDKNFLFFTFLSMMFTGIMSGVQIFLGVWLNGYFDLSARDIGFFWAISGLVMTAVQLNIAKIFNARKSLIYGLILYSLSIGAFVFSDSVYLVLLSSIIMTVGIAMVNPSIQSSLSLKGDKHQQGLIFGINQSMSSLGRVIGPTLIGLLFLINIKIAWSTISIIVMLMGVLTIRFFKKDKI